MRDLLVPLKNISNEIKDRGVQPGSERMIAEYIDQSITEIKQLRHQCEVLSRRAYFASKPKEAQS